MNPAEATIADILVRHERALNTSDALAIADLFGTDGVLMPNHAPSVVGTLAIGEAYRGIFSGITSRLEVTIEEIRQLSPDWAFARTHCAGTSQSRSSGLTNSARIQQLALFRVVDGKWKIARCCLAATPHDPTA